MRARILLFLALMAATPAAAHALLEHAEPAVGSTVAPVDTIRLHYSEPVEPRFSSVTLTDEDGTKVPGDKPALDPADSTVFVLHLPAPLRAGRYKVDWHVVSVDTHRTEGSFGFTVASP